MRKPLDRPNIILINADDLGYGDLSCYGSKVNATPALDAMASEGARFTDFYMPAPLCTPSRAGMLTGCYPRRIGMDRFGPRNDPVLFPGDAEGLHPDEITIATLLRGQGYATKLVGKWHVGDQAPFLPTRHGFDEFYGLPYSNDMGMMIQWPRYPPLPLMREEAIIQEQPDQAGLTERYVEESVRFLRANRDRPFFLYLAHMYVHVPLFVPEHFRADSRNGAYGAAVACIDWAAAALFRELKALGIDGNTLVIFTSDNGSSARDGGSNAPLRGAKGSTWEGGQRLPCIMRWPGVIPGGTTCGEIASAIDFLPTFAGMAGAKVPTDRVIDGRNILPLMRGDAGARSPHEAFYYYRAGHLEAVRSGRWKWRLVPGELYNLERDVGEQTNVAGDNPEVVRSLQALAERGRADIGDLATGTVGSGSRPVGKVENPVTLTQYDPSHPYIVAMYDCAGRTTPREKQVAQKPASEKFVWPVVGPQ